MTQTELQQYLDYDKTTGVFTWLVKVPHSKKHVGDIAGGRHTASGYHRITLNHAMYKSHRLAWLYVYGYLPTSALDHINKDRSDNSISNLREVTTIENSKNQKVPTNNTSGRIGIHQSTRDGKYVAKISNNGVRVYLGNFPTLEGAINAREAAEVLYDYHENHGGLS